MDQKVLRKELQKLVADSPDETYYDTSIHNKTNVNKFNNLDIVQLKQTFQDEFYKQFINYNHSKIIGLENFQYIDSIIGVTQYIDNLFIMYRDIYALPLEYRYSFLLNGKTIDTLQDIPDNSHILVSVPQPNCADIPKKFNDILDISSAKNLSIHLDLAWWCISKGLQLDLTNKNIVSLATSLSKPFALEQNRIGIRFNRYKVDDSITIQNKRNMIPRACFEIGLSYLQQNNLNDVWNKYNKIYYETCKITRMKPTSIYFLAGQLGKGNTTINLALEKMMYYGS